MDSTVLLKPIREVDQLVIREVYSDAIYTQASSCYSNQQIDVWASLASLPGVLDKPLQQGNGWLVIEKGNIEAFAIRFPSDRLALLYCRGRSSRKGYATNLLHRIELDASNEGKNILFTEASLISYPLFLKCGWIKNSVEHILISGVSFDRYKMSKILQI